MENRTFAESMTHRFIAEISSCILFAHADTGTGSAAMLIHILKSVTMNEIIEKVI